MANKNPKVTIIIPVYNGEDYVSQAIDSALTQTYDNKEIIVINDGSTDESEKVIKKYKNIKYIKKKNGGVASALNEGIKAASGEYISWLSHDDLYYPEKVEEEMNFLMEQNSKDVIVACNVELVDKDLNLITKHSLPKDLEEYPLSYLTFDVKTGLNGCALLIPKKVFDKNGYFDEELKVTQDYDMWSRFAKNEKFVILDKILVKSRQHDKQGSKVIKCVQQEVDNLHSRFINMISDTEFKEYFKGDINKVIETISLFKNDMRSFNAACALLKKAIKVFNEDEQLMNYFYDNILQNRDNSISLIENKNKKRLLYYNNSWIRGGIERVISTQFEGFCKDYDIYFVASTFKDEEAFPIPKEVKVLKISKDITSGLPETILCLCYILDIDIFIGNQNLNINLLNTYKLLNKNNISSIASNHYSYYLPVEMHYLYPVVTQRDECYEAASAVVWTNKTSAELHAIKAKNSYYIPNPNSYPIAKDITKNNKNIVCVGRFDDGLKHIDWTLDVFSRALKEDPELKLYVVGKIDMNQFIFDQYKCKLEKHIERLKLPSSSVIFVGQTDKVEEYYKKASLLILTSQSEGFGMVITEAANFGVPSISFDILGIDGLITDNENGYLVDCYDLDKMARKIVDYFKDQDNMTKMKKEAKRRSEAYTSEKVLEEWKKLFDDVLNNKVKGNVEVTYTLAETQKIFENTIINSQQDIETMDELREQNKNIFARTYRNIFEKVMFQYKSYGIKKLLLEIIKYPFKIIRKIVRKIIK